MYLVLMLASFVSLVLIYNFFELIGDMLRNNISLWKMFTYLFFLTPQLIYDCCRSASWWRCWRLSA